MIERVPADRDYGQPADPGWRGKDWSPHLRDVVLDGRRMRYLDVGGGKSCFVLVHGMGGRWQHWLESVPTLAEHARVLAVDLPGFGASEPPAGRVSLEGFADAIAQLARTLDIGRLVLAGHSMGGPVAVRFAARHPDLASGIVLVAGAVYQFSALLGLREVPRFARERPRETAAIAAEVATAGLPVPAIARRLIANTTIPRRLLLAPYALHPQALPADTVSLIIDGAGAPGVMPTARAIGRSDPMEGIELVRCPILSLAGDSDRISPLADTETFQRTVPRARTVVLQECGHMLMLERPRAFNTQLRAFARQLT